MKSVKECQKCADVLIRMFFNNAIECSYTLVKSFEFVWLLR